MDNTWKGVLRFLAILWYLRPPLKIIMFPVHRPGDLISGEWDFFF